MLASLVLLSGCAKRKKDAPTLEPDAQMQRESVPAGDVAKLQGTWNVVAGESNGEPAPQGMLNGATISFAGKRSVMMGKEGTFEIDEHKQPHGIEFDRAGSKQIGIYQLSGDDLKICVGPADDRPKDFKTKPRTDHTMLVLKRKRN